MHPLDISSRAVWGENNVLHEQNVYFDKHFEKGKVVFGMQRTLFPAEHLSMATTKNTLVVLVAIFDVVGMKVFLE